jgi:hypothetical protein
MGWVRRAPTIAALVLVTACGGSGGDDDTPLTGVWQYVSGPAFSSSEFSDGDFEGSPRFLVLDPDGDVTLVQQEATSEAVFCNHGIFTTTSTSLFLQFNRRFDRPTFVFLRDQPDGQTLTLVDSGESVTTFVRRETLPAEFACRAFSVRATVAPLVRAPTFWTGLAWDGASLYFTTEDPEDVVPLDRVSGAIGAPLPFNFSQFRMVHAAEGDDLWVHCACGHNEVAQRRTKLDALVDAVDTEGDLGDELVLFAIAHDAVNDHLWLQGESFDDQVGRLMTVSSGVEPDVLLQTSDFDTRLRSMTWDGTHLWAITLAQNVLRIDPVSRKAIEAYESPDIGVEWAGIASAPATAGGGNSLFLIGQDEATQEGVLIEVQP